jgi:hypothetical protein
MKAREKWESLPYAHPFIVWCLLHVIAFCLSACTLFAVRVRVVTPADECERTQKLINEVLGRTP